MIYPSLNMDPAEFWQEQNGHKMEKDSQSIFRNK